MPQSPTWTDAEKAQWILENQWNHSKITYIYECVGETVYRRPSMHSPPWIPREREFLYNCEKNNADHTETQINNLRDTGDTHD